MVSTIARINLIIIEVIMPRNVAKPALNACDCSLPANISPMTAPAKRPKIIPKGGKNIIPTSIPIAAPQTPERDAPCFFAPIKGNK